MAQSERRSTFLLVREAEEAIDRRLKVLKKQKSVLSTASKKLDGQPGSRRVLEKLIKDLEAAGSTDTSPEAALLLSGLREHLLEQAGQFERELRENLRNEAERLGLPAAVSGDGLTVGPFGVSLNFNKETASLTYAKTVVEDRLPLDAIQITNRVSTLMEELISPPGDLQPLASELEEAVRVAAVRARQPIASDELRAELPAVYREMSFLRQSKNRPLSKATVREYPLPRFVVEIKTLIQSDLNMTSERRFRLETAVIENTRNAKKSVFVPVDLAKGYGEGTYFQAIILTGTR